jgi:capsule polysaccharide export protein KpsE/RkpR
MTSNVGSPLISDKEIDLREYVSLFWGQKWIIAASTAVFTMGFLAYSLTLKPVFTSTSKFITKTGSGNAQGGQLATLARLGGFNIGGGQEDQDPLSHIEMIVQNVDFLEKVLERKWSINGDSLTLPQIWKVRADTTLPDWRYRQKMANIDRLRKGVLSFSSMSGLRVLTTSAETPELAFQLNGYMLDLVNDYMKNNVKSQTKENRIFVEERIGEIREELAHGENDLAAFLRSNLNLSSPQVSLQYKRLQRNVAINEEVYLQLRKEYELSRIQEKKDQPFVIVIKQPEIALAKSKPKRKVIVFAGAFFGVMFGFFAAMMRLILRKR